MANDTLSTEAGGQTPGTDAHTIDQSNIIKQPSRAAKRARYPVMLLLAVAWMTLSFGSGHLALIGPDEPRYAEVAREMVVTGDYISPRLCGCLWFEKPVLYYWTAAGAFHLLGVNEFAARLPSAFSALASALALFFIGRRFATARMGLIASMVFVTSGIVIGYARAATPDMALTAAICVAIGCGHLVLEGGRRRRTWLLASGAATGVAVLAKGLVGIVLVVTILAVYAALAGRLRSVRLRDCLWWAAAFFFTAGLWYVPVTVEHGGKFISDFFIGHHFERYLSNRFGHPQPAYFFWFIALAGVMPWSAFFIPAIARIRSLRPRHSPTDALFTLAWVWACVPLVFYSFSGSKLPGYILPIFPALAIILGAEVERLWNGERARALLVSAWLTALLLCVVGVAFILHLSREGIPFGIGSAILFALPLLCGLLATAGAFRGKFRHVALWAMPAVVAVIVGAVFLLFPKMNCEISLKQLSLEAAANLRPNERITFFIKKEFAPVFYAQGRVVCGGDESSVLNALHPNVIAGLLLAEPSLVVITTENWLDDLAADGLFDIEPLASQGDAHALRVTLKQ